MIFVKRDGSGKKKKTLWKKEKKENKKEWRKKKEKKKITDITHREYKSTKCMCVSYVLDRLFINAETHIVSH